MLCSSLCDLRNNWTNYHPHTNVLWLHYLCSKLLSMRYRSARGKAVKAIKDALTQFKDSVIMYGSATEVLQTCPIFREWRSTVHTGWLLTCKIYHVWMYNSFCHTNLCSSELLWSSLGEHNSHIRNFSTPLYKKGTYKNKIFYSIS